MYKDLLVHSPLAPLAIFALFVFVAVFVAVVVRVLAQPRREIEAFSRIPLDDDKEHNHDR